MKRPSARIYWLLIPVALVVLLDEWFKYIALQRLPEQGSLVDPGIFQLAIHQNWGIAFDIPFKLEFVLFFSGLIGLGLLRIAYENRRQHPEVTFATITILIGAMGNLYDRLIYGFTVDYLIFFERSAINLSDIIIVSGVILLLLFSRRTKNPRDMYTDDQKTS